MEEKVFMFWKYDLFPYVLSSTGVINPDGKTVNLDGYGQWGIKGMIAYQPLSLGKETQKELEKLRSEYHRKEKELLEEYKKKALKVLPVLATLGYYKE